MYRKKGEGSNTDYKKNKMKYYHNTEESFVMATSYQFILFIFCYCCCLYILLKYFAQIFPIENAFYSFCSIP